LAEFEPPGVPTFHHDPPPNPAVSTGSVSRFASAYAASPVALACMLLRHELRLASRRIELITGHTTEAPISSTAATESTSRHRPPERQPARLKGQGLFAQARGNRVKRPRAKVCRWRHHRRLDHQRRQRRDLLRPRTQHPWHPARIKLRDQQRIKRFDIRLTQHVFAQGAAPHHPLKRPRAQLAPWPWRRANRIKQPRHVLNRARVRGDRKPIARPRREERVNRLGARRRQRLPHENILGLIHDCGSVPASIPSSRLTRSQFRANDATAA
jgi:hypothetical protein